MRTAIATVICCNNCQRRHTNSRCHTDNCRRADSASSHGGFCFISPYLRYISLVVVAPVVVVVVPVVPVVASVPFVASGAANAAGVVNMKAIRIAESLCFITFPLFIAWTIRTLEIRIVYFEYNILVKSPFPHTACTIYCG